MCEPSNQSVFLITKFAVDVEINSLSGLPMELASGKLSLSLCSLEWITLLNQLIQHIRVSLMCWPCTNCFPRDFYSTQL